MLTVDTPTAPTQRAQTRLPLGLNRANWVLISLLALQLILLIVLLWPRPNANAAAAPLLGALTAADIKAFTVADTEGNTVGVERTGEGWTLTGTDGYTATVTKVDDTLAKLLAIKTNSLVTRTPSSHRQLKVASDNFDRRITITGPDGDHVLYIGVPGGNSAYHVRLDGEDSTWLTSAVAPWQLETAPGSWVDAQYFTVPKDEITAVALTNAAGALKLSRQADDTWTLDDLAAGEEVDAAQVDAFLNQVATVMLSSPLGTAPTPEYGMDTPQATVELTQRSADGSESNQTLQLGAKNDDGLYYLKASNSPWYVTLAAPTGDAIAQKTRADFLVPPATATPAAEAEDAPAEFPSSLLSPLATPAPGQ